MVDSARTYKKLLLSESSKQASEILLSLSHPCLMRFTLPDLS